MAETRTGLASDRTNGTRNLTLNQLGFGTVVCVAHLPHAACKRQNEPVFTGIVVETGTVERITPTAKSIKLTVRGHKAMRNLKLGDSLAINGCCLTVVNIARDGRHRLAQFDLLQESWKRTNLQFARRGSLVNLEPSLCASGELGGHFVTGHVDGLGRITRWERAGQDHVLDIEAPADVRRYIVFKGSVAVDGISLTVAAVTSKGFRIWIIPHTFEITALRERRVGDCVNLEADILGKYVEKFLRARRAK
jgi:riboflavin synthase